MIMSRDPLPIDREGGRPPLCPEAAALLDGRKLGRCVQRELDVLTPCRQSEVIRALIALDRFTVTFAAVLVTATPAEQFADLRQRRVNALNRAQLGWLEKACARLERRLDLVRTAHCTLSLELVLARGFLDRLLSNARVVRHLAQHHPDQLRDFQGLIDPPSRRGAAGPGRSRADRGTGVSPSL